MKLLSLPVRRGDADDRVALHSDGGGLAAAALHIVSDEDKVSRFFVGIARRARRRGQYFHREVRVVNGLPALLMIAEGRVQTLIGFAVSNNLIESVFVQRNPEKLRSLDARIFSATDDRLQTGTRAASQALT